LKAIRFPRYGSPDVLRLEDVETPELEADDQVLVRVRAASVNPVDWHRLRGEPWLLRAGEGLLKPKDPWLGADLAGVVEAVGPKVTSVRPGDEVFGMSIRTLAEVARVTDQAVVPKPANVSFEEAGAVGVAALTALQGLRKGATEAGARVLVNGASGGVGTYAVQIAKALGAEVTGVCSTRNVELVRSLGADHVVDYTREDFTRGGERYDVILDAVANRSVRRLRRVLEPRGTIVWVGGAKGRTGGRPLLRLVGAVKRRGVVVFIAKRDRDDLLFLSGLLERGELRTVIDRTYPLDETAEAIRRLETGRARGKIVVTI
jgi:NADPH:quinone reductase-like Zn-dependent oxidoreductase